MNSKPVCYPLVHLNGTSKESLMDQLDAVYYALGEAYDKMKRAAPNRRDYYPLPGNWWDEAVAQQRRRLQAIDDLRENIAQEIALISEGPPHCWNDYAKAKGGAP